MTATLKTKLAYLVKHDEACEIIYATNSAAARRLGAQEIGVDFTDIESCCRASYLDEYAQGGGPPAKLLIEEHDWRFECGHCFDSVDQWAEERVYDEYGNPYCCPRCLVAEQQKQAASKAAKQALQAAATERWPGATICWLNEQKGAVFLRITSAKAGAMWDQSTDALFCQPGDEAGWQAYKNSLAFAQPTPATQDAAAPAGPAVLPLIYPSPNHVLHRKRRHPSGPRRQH